MTIKQKINRVLNETEQHFSLEPAYRAKDIDAMVDIFFTGLSTYFIDITPQEIKACVKVEKLFSDLAKINIDPSWDDSNWFWPVMCRVELYVYTSEDSNEIEYVVYIRQPGKSANESVPTKTFDEVLFVVASSIKAHVQRDKEATIKGRLDSIEDFTKQTNEYKVQTRRQDRILRSK